MFMGKNVSFYLAFTTNMIQSPYIGQKALGLDNEDIDPEQMPSRNYVFHTLVSTFWYFSHCS